MINVCPKCDIVIYEETEYCPNCQCGQCGKFILNDDYGICEDCGLPVCEDCQQSCQGPPNPMVDYSIHSECYENLIWQCYES
jgi:RNA polymerase subunit RPABC4/transcription elongation factor Spt4